MKRKKELTSSHRNLNQFLEVFHFTAAAIEELNTQVFLDSFHATLNELVVF